jgi:hypothetical protein
MKYICLCLANTINKGTKNNYKTFEPNEKIILAYSYIENINKIEGKVNMNSFVCSSC